MHRNRCKAKRQAIIMSKNEFSPCKSLLIEDKLLRVLIHARNSSRQSVSATGSLGTLCVQGLEEKESIRLMKRWSIHMLLLGEARDRHKLIHKGKSNTAASFSLRTFSLVSGCAAVVQQQTGCNT